jgi:SAM-dependent methyltransferase
LGVDQWYWGYRGIDQFSMRADLNRHFSIQGKAVLLAGSGSGRGVDSWMKYQPSRLLGVDLFDYTKAWNAVRVRYSPAVDFMQADLRDLHRVPNDSFDIVGSDAVLEHITDLPKALAEMRRVLRPDGRLWASFGPLYHSYGGDHVSGYDHTDNGYNHLLLKPDEYRSYMDAKGEYRHHEYEDGRTWVNNGLFSYLKIHQYLEVIRDAGFVWKYRGLVVDPKGLSWLKRHPDGRKKLLEQTSELDLVCGAVCMVAARTDQPV